MEMKVGQWLTALIAVVMLVDGIVAHRDGGAIERLWLVERLGDVLGGEAYQSMDATALTMIGIPRQSVGRGILIRC